MLRALLFSRPTPGLDASNVHPARQYLVSQGPNPGAMEVGGLDKPARRFRYPSRFGPEATADDRMGDQLQYQSPSVALHAAPRQVRFQP